MKSITLKTHKNKGKITLNVFWLCLCLFLLGIGVYGCFAKFKISYLLTTLAVLAISCYYGYNIRNYFWNKYIDIKVTLVNNELLFEVISDKPNDVYETIKVNLLEVKQVYELEIRDKLITYKLLEYIPTSGSEPVEIDFLPWPFDCDANEIQSILQLIKTHYPAIKIGLDK